MAGLKACGSLLSHSLDGASLTSGRSWVTSLCKHPRLKIQIMKLEAALRPASCFKPVAFYTVAKLCIGLPTSAGKDLQVFQS